MKAPPSCVLFLRMGPHASPSVQIPALREPAPAPGLLPLEPPRRARGPPIPACELFSVSLFFMCRPRGPRGLAGFAVSLTWPWPRPSRSLLWLTARGVWSASAESLLACSGQARRRLGREAGTSWPVPTPPGTPPPSLASSFIGQEGDWAWGSGHGQAESEVVPRHSKCAE